MSEWPQGWFRDGKPSDGPAGSGEPTVSIPAGQSGPAGSAAGQYRVPATYSYRQHVQEGGLMSYGADTGTYSSARLLHRSHPERISPADLPAQAPVKFAIAINLKTAKALGLDIPPNPRGLADEVI